MPITRMCWWICQRSMAIEEVVQLLKGGSSHWVNESNLVPGKFGWQRGYGAFSVSALGSG